MWVDALLKWYRAEKRWMPWRDNPSGYYTWISEMMLQQTQVVTVIPYFERFIQRFPTVQDLAAADLQEVLKCWEGLGYYSRARYLHKAAQMLVSNYDGTLPESYDGLQKLPGIGPYCAAAIASIAFDQPVPVVDGNVLRVFTRFWGIFDDIRLPKVRNMLFAKLSGYISACSPSDFNQAIMECGALICTPSSPKCEICPLAEDCFARKGNQQAVLPVKSKLAKVPHHHIVVGLIKKEGRVLIAKRKETQMLGGMWEFPGGKMKSEESEEQALVREIKEEVGLSVQVLDKVASVKHAYSHFKITMHAYWCSVTEGVEQALSGDEVRWVGIDEFEKYPFPTANKKLFKKLMS